MKKRKLAALFDGDFFMEHITSGNMVSMSYYHYHNMYEIYFLCEGDRYYFINDKCYHIPRGTIVFINPYEIHYTTSKLNQYYERILVSFKKEFIEELTQVLTDIDLYECFRENIYTAVLNKNDAQIAEQLLRGMLNEYKKKNPGYQTYLKTALIQLLIFINRKSKEHLQTDIGYVTSFHKTISEITRYINNNFAEDLTLEHISSKFYISTHYFSRKFKAISGFPFTDYVNNVRIKEAQKLLINTDMKVIDIGQKVGFKTPTHFQRTFKKITGVSPYQYRKNNR